ncbi:MAG: class I SAM-dependent methyltransferase [Planctomycetota bacterium]
MVMHRTTGDTHQERLESFYADQAEHYDSFRSRLLHGRPGLFGSIDFPRDGVWVDMGCGTGENVDFAGDRAGKLAQVHLVDLSPSLLDVAQRRVANDPRNMKTHLADATEFSLPAGSVDVVTFSYSLTMIPDWFEAIARAEEMLKPGGLIGVTDFYVSRKHADSAGTQHGWLKRAFWTHWFANDNVFLDGERLGMLTRRFETVHRSEHYGKVPYLPLIRAPYYQFIGRKPSTTT